jgi:hypothetical protein
MAACMRLYNGQLVETCRQFGVECIDLASLLPQTAQVFYDDCHFTEFGAELVAGIVADYLNAKPPFRDESFELSER